MSKSNTQKKPRIVFKELPVFKMNTVKGFQERIFYLANDQERNLGVIQIFQGNLDYIKP